MLPKKPKDVLQHRHSMPNTRPGSMMGSVMMGDSIMNGSIGPARALPPYPTDDGLSSAAQSISSGHMNSSLRNDPPVFSMPDLPLRPGSGRNDSYGRQPRTPLPNPNSFTYDDRNSYSDSDDEDSYDRRFHDSSDSRLPDLPIRTNRRIQNRLSLPPLPPAHSQSVRRNDGASDHMINDFANLAVDLPSLPVGPVHSSARSAQDKYLQHIPKQIPTKLSNPLPSLPSIQSTPPTLQHQSPPPSVQSQPPFPSTLPSPAALARNHRSPSPNKYNQPLHTTPPPLSVNNIPPIPKPTITGSPLARPISPMRKPVNGSVKRKPVGSGANSTQALTHILSDDDTEKLENLPFSPDSYNTTSASNVTLPSSTALRSHLPQAGLPSQQQANGDVLDFSSYAPEPVPRKKERPLPPSGVDPGLAGYDGDGQWGISQQLNAGYGESLYKKISPSPNRPSKPRLPPKIPKGMTREEYMAAEPPKPRDPFVYRDYV